jgi:hypothetical protein
LYRENELLVKFWQASFFLKGFLQACLVHMCKVHFVCQVQDKAG